MFAGCPGFGSDFLEQWPDSLMHTLSVSLYPSFFGFQTHTHTHWDRQSLTETLLSCIYFLRKHGCLPNYCLPTLYSFWHPFNIIRLQQVVFKTVLFFSQQEPEEKALSHTTSAFRWGKFHWVISRAALTYSNHDDYLTQVYFFLKKKKEKQAADTGCSTRQPSRRWSRHFLISLTDSSLIF